MCGPPPAEAAPLLASTRPTASLRCAAVVSAALCLLAYAARGPAAGLAPAALAVEADGPATDGPPDGWARVLDRHLLDGDPRAVCNDGTPALYYHAPSARGGAAWVVHLQGGGACVSADECAANEAAYAAKGQTWHFSSKASKEHLGAAAGTILSDGESALLGDAHAVYVWYCSSDAWVGDRGASDATGGRHFRGSRIVDAVFDDLERNRGLGAAGAETLVVFSGSSAGGRGVVQHADRLAKRVRETCGGTLLAVVDSAVYLDLPMPADARRAVDGTAPGSPTPWAETYARNQLAFAHGRVAERCAAEFAAADAWRCYVTENALPYVEAPLVVFQALDDAFLLHRVSDINPDAMAADDAAAFAAWRGSEASYLRSRLDAAQRAASARVHARYEAAFAKLPATAAVYAPSCWMHEQLTKGAAVVGDGGGAPELLGNYRNLEAVGGESFAAYVDRFAAAALAGGAPPAPVVDACAGFACGAGCFATARGEVADVAHSFAYAAACFDALPAP